MTITLKEFKKFAAENDILWFYNKPLWRTTPFDVDSKEFRKYNKEQIDEIRKMYKEDDARDTYLYGNWHEAIFGTPEEREKERINLLNKKELQMCKSEDKRIVHHALISELTDHLGDAIRGLENLADEVEGQEKEPIDVAKKTAEETRKNPSLSQFLDHYPERLETLNKRVTEATNRMRELLF